MLLLRSAMLLLKYSICSWCKLHFQCFLLVFSCVCWFTNMPRTKWSYLCLVRYRSLSFYFLKKKKCSSFFFSKALECWHWWKRNDCYWNRQRFWYQCLISKKTNNWSIILWCRWLMQCSEVHRCGASCHFSYAHSPSTYISLSI